MGSKALDHGTGERGPGIRARAEAGASRYQAGQPVSGEFGARAGGGFRDGAGGGVGTDQGGLVAGDAELYVAGADPWRAVHGGVGRVLGGDRIFPVGDGAASVFGARPQPGAGGERDCVRSAAEVERTFGRRAGGPRIHSEPVAGKGSGEAVAERRRLETSAGIVPDDARTGIAGGAACERAAGNPSPSVVR